MSSPDMKQTDREFFSEQFAIIHKRLDQNDELLAAMAQSVELSAKSGQKMVELIDSALNISHSQHAMQREIDGHNFRISLIEMRLEMPRGEPPE